ncbi:hypothetical protein FACS1894164_13240 [Spirochaetia bacterium]|nr:hypothetical protein FACS1894164_13240 [Spirochaetia bacterium]
MKMLLFIASTLLFSLNSCVSTASAEEYYTIGIAYLDIGKYAEAEQWLKKAYSSQKTRNAAGYNLGRIKFEQGQYEEAFAYFDGILVRDPNNVTVLRAAAYTAIKLENTSRALALYNRVLRLVPESTDDGYNYALVLYSLKRYEQAESVLARHPNPENKESSLLLARIMRAEHKPEALDHYAAWLEKNKDPAVSFEFAQLLEEDSFYARAIEKYRQILKDLPAASTNPKPAQVNFALARLLLTADPENPDGILTLETAFKAGADRKDVEVLLENPDISDQTKESIRRILAAESPAPEPVKENTESAEEEP